MNVCMCVCIFLHVYQTVDVFDLLPGRNCLTVEGLGYILHVCACVCMCEWMCVNADLWRCHDSCDHKGENFGVRKLADLANCELDAEIFLANIHKYNKKVFDICTDFSLFAYSLYL